MMVLLLVVDSLRADAPGYAGGRAATPALDQLAGEGTTFDHLTVSGSWTVPSLTSMATGTFPHRVGICRWRHAFPRRRPTLMSAFAAADFDVHVLAHNPRWLFGSCPHRGKAGDSQEVDQVLDALRHPRGSDRFVILHHWWTHLPYLNRKLPASGWKRACEMSLESMNRSPETMVPKFRANYLKTVEYFSAELLERYLDAASAGGEDVLLLLTGDHGENWGEALPAGRRIEHIFDLHGRWMRDSTARVPLLLWGKGHGGAIPAGARLGGTVRGVDVAPTLADLAGIPWPGPLPEADGPQVVDRGIQPDGVGLELDGRSAAAPIRAGEDLPTETTLTVSTHNTHQPDTYPPGGKETFRTLGLRTEDAWLVFDGVDGTRDVIPEGGGEAPPAASGEHWDRLEAEWHRAVDPGPGLDIDLFPTVRPGEASPEPVIDDIARVKPKGRKVDEREIVRKMRMLGYMD